MIRATRGRVLVAMLSSLKAYHNPHNLVLVDKKKHYDHSSRRGKVVSVGAGVRSVRVGDVVVFRGDAGFTLDYDPEKNLDESTYRWLRESECLAIDETEEALA